MPIPLIALSLPARKRVALVAHDNQKDDLAAWAAAHREQLDRCELFATGTTGARLEASLGRPITRLLSGPLGGDQQLGALIAEGRVDVLIFFWDPLEPMPHDPDVKALLRLAVVWNIPIANNRATADFLIASPWMNQAYARPVPDYAQYQRDRAAQP